MSTIKQILAEDTLCQNRLYSSVISDEIAKKPANNIVANNKPFVNHVRPKSNKSRCVRKYKKYNEQPQALMKLETQQVVGHNTFKFQINQQQKQLNSDIRQRRNQQLLKNQANHQIQTLSVDTNSNNKDNQQNNKFEQLIDQAQFNDTLVGLSLYVKNEFTLTTVVQKHIQLYASIQKFIDNDLLKIMSLFMQKMQINVHNIRNFNYEQIHLFDVMRQSVQQQFEIFCCLQVQLEVLLQQNMIQFQDIIDSQQQYETSQNNKQIDQDNEEIQQKQEYLQLLDNQINQKTDQIDKEINQIILTMTSNELQQHSVSYVELNKLIKPLLVNLFNYYDNKYINEQSDQYTEARNFIFNEAQFQNQCVQYLDSAIQYQNHQRETDDKKINQSQKRLKSALFPKVASKSLQNNQFQKLSKQNVNSITIDFQSPNECQKEQYIHKKFAIKAKSMGSQQLGQYFYMNEPDKYKKWISNKNK